MNKFGYLPAGHRNDNAYTEDSYAWRRYAAAALQMSAILVGDASPTVHAERASDVADAMLEEERKRR